MNARYHEQEAFIIANAGIPGAVTIATNMAGRGTDIQLGGNVDMIFKQRKEKSKEDINILKQKISEEVEKSKGIVKEAGGILESIEENPNPIKTGNIICSNNQEEVFKKFSEIIRSSVQ